jgi:sugar phosphate isomerase/epimerase
MKISFSSLACPRWTLDQVVKVGAESGYEGIELRFLEGEDSLWKLPRFQGAALEGAKRMIADRGLSVACLGTSCRFHSPDAQERAGWVEEGLRMAELAAALGAPGIRVFGDKLQPGENRDSTRNWIADGIRQLAARIPDEVEVWLETHGDFAASEETMAILERSEHEEVGVVWDPANAFIDGGEQPPAAAGKFGRKLKHVHLRDLDGAAGDPMPVLTGQGKFALREILAELERLKYDHFISFEWEKKWRPELAEPEVAIPHFAEWFRQTSRRP